MIIGDEGGGIDRQGDEQGHELGDDAQATLKIETPQDRQLPGE